MSAFELHGGKKISQGHLDFAAAADIAPPQTEHPLVEFFGQPISVYTRRQAIEDGILVQLSGDGYEGDAWIPEMVAEAGIKIPVALTTTVFMDCVCLTKAAERALNDIKGRMWDVLYMFAEAVRRLPANRDQMIFELYVVRNRVRPDRVKLKALIGPGDEGEPVITIMYPNED